MAGRKGLIVEPCSFEVGLSTVADTNAYNICHTAYILHNWTEDLVKRVFNSSTFATPVKIGAINSTTFFVCTVGRENVFSTAQGLQWLIKSLKELDTPVTLLFSETRILRELRLTYDKYYTQTLLRKLTHIYIGVLEPIFTVKNSNIKFETTFMLRKYSCSGAWANDKYRIVLPQRKPLHKD